MWGPGDFGTSPIFVQLSDKPLLARVYYVGCRNLKHNGRSRNYALAIAAWPRPVLGLLVEIPTALGIPLGFIINELITNSAKYAKGTITVRLGTVSADNHWLSVSDDGPGLPAEFDPVGGRGLGMKIIQALVRQIGGELHIARANENRGACFTVTFNAQGLEDKLSAGAVLVTSPAARRTAPQQRQPPTQ